MRKIKNANANTSHTQMSADECNWKNSNLNWVSAKRVDTTPRLEFCEMDFNMGTRGSHSIVIQF